MSDPPSILSVSVQQEFAGAFIQKDGNAATFLSSIFNAHLKQRMQRAPNSDLRHSPER
jgi:hypothetical protein